MSKYSFYVSRDTEAQKVYARLTEQHKEYSYEECDIMVVLGGDGTMLDALHMLHDKSLDKPVYGLNCGSVGFLLNPYDCDRPLEKAPQAHETVIYPLALRASFKDGSIKEAIAFNEVALLRESRQTAKLKISVDDTIRIDELIGDGILLSTPAGSTAYNLSADGPILPISANLLSLTPISAFRPRRWRGALLSAEVRVKIEVLHSEKRPVSVTADSKEFRDICSAEIHQDCGRPYRLMFDPDHNLGERIMKEQFVA